MNLTREQHLTVIHLDISGYIQSSTDLEKSQWIPNNSEALRDNVSTGKKESCTS